MDPTKNPGVEKCLTFINCNLSPAKSVRSSKSGKAPLAITISRECGAGGHEIAVRLTTLLQAQAVSPNAPWTVFDRNLIDKVLEDHNLPTRLGQFLHEDRVNELEDIMQEILGTQPSSWKLVGQVTETILKLAELGNVILVGRGANVITAQLDHVFHVRLVGSIERRVERIRQQMNLSQREAEALAAKEDRGRARYLKKYFGVAIDNPLLHHLTINTDRLDLGEAAELIAVAARRHAGRS
ncbi:MAG: cytidylate kinase-like family protein [Limisphaerales bacterium]